MVFGLMKSPVCSVESLKADSLQVFGIEARFNCRGSIIVHCMTPVNARKTPGRMIRMINDAINADGFTPKVRGRKERRNSVFS